MARSRAAEILSVTPRQINHLMTTWQVKRPIATYMVASTLSQIKWEIRKKYAMEFIAGTCTIEEAAENSEVSTRQMRRWVSDLLDKHFEMKFKDLKDVSAVKRQRLANEIESAEGLEYAKQSVIEAIRRGEMTMQDEAAARLARRTMRRNASVRRKQETKPGPRKVP